MKHHAGTQQKPAPVKCGERWLNFDQPLIMGVINLTSDSFFSGSRIVDPELVVDKMIRMEEEGADIIDLGAMSSRPGAEISSADIELDRLMPVLESLPDSFGIPVSIDTIHARVALECIHAGAAMVNDISAGELDQDMISVVAELGIPYIAMHMKGRPADMQSKAEYPMGVGAEVLSYMINKLRTLREAGIKDVIIDPGFGFAKTISHNYQLLHHLSALRVLDVPILAGLSRKSMIWRTLEVTAEEALYGTSVVNTLALTKGADILRVHDVKEAVECRKIWNVYCNNK